MGLSRAIRRELLDHLFGKAYTAPTIYLALSSTAPTTAGGNVTEPSSGDYARKQAASGDWAAASDADPAEILNANALEFTAASGDWLAGADLTHAILFSAASGGTYLGSGALTTAKPVLSGDTARFPAGSISITQGDPA